MKKQVLNAIKDIEKIDSYIGLDDSPKQINLNKNNLDVERWDIRKFVELSIKSNPKIAEWLRSPIVYIDSPIRKQLKKYLKGTKKIDWKSIINTNPNKILLEIKKKL